MSAILCASGSTRLSREELHGIVPPPPTQSWQPIAHGELITTLEAELLRRNLSIKKEEFAVQRDGALLFGVLDLVWGHTSGEHWAAIGLRTSNDKSMSLQLAVGMRIFVCDNLMFAGDLIALKRRHTSGLDLAIEISQALDRYQQGFMRLTGQVEALKSSHITNEQARLLIFQVFEKAIMPVRFFHAVTETYFDPDNAMERYGAPQHLFPENSMWALHNAFTHHLKKMAPGPGFTANVKLGKLFGLGK